MSLKDKWAAAGKGIGKSFASLGKGIVKSVKVGLDRTGDDAAAEEARNTDLRETWSEVGHNFGDAGKSLGKAAAGTAEKVVGEDDEKKEQPTEEAKEENKEEAKEETKEETTSNENDIETK